MALRILFFLAKLSSSSMEQPQSLLSGAVSGIGEDAVCHLYGNPVDFRCTRARAPWRVTRRWAGRCNQTYWGLREGFLRWAIACRWYPRVSMKIPITIMGNDSSCPMEIDPKKNPI